MNIQVLVLVLFNLIRISLFQEICIPTETRVSGTYAIQHVPSCANELIFEENFDHFDLEKWQHEITLSGGGNWEFQYYTNNRSNSYVENGHLHIRPTLLTEDHEDNFLRSGTLDINGGLPEQCSDASFYGCIRTGTNLHYLNSVKSAKIKTYDSFSFKYGRIVIRAKMPSGDWLWPAIWMMPRYNSYGKWPASGEIDIVESRGNKKLLNQYGANIGTQQVASTVHWGPFSGVNGWPKTHYIKSDSMGYDMDFHEYELRWSSTNMTFLVDQEIIGIAIPPEGGFWSMGEFPDVDNPWRNSSKMAPFDQKFYIIINLAVGGISYFADDNTNPGGKPWKNNSTTSYRDFWKGREQWLSTWYSNGDNCHLIVDYVKVYSI